MKKIIVRFFCSLFLLKPFLTYADITLEFNIFKADKNIGKSVLYVSENAVRNDFIMPNEHFSLIGINHKAHYLINLKTSVAEKMSQSVAIEFAKAQMLKQGIKLDTQAQINNMMQMSVDPSNDEDNNILFEPAEMGTYNGYQQGELLYRIETALASELKLTPADLALIQQQAFNYQVLAKTSVAHFDNLPIELLHIIKYQDFELFKSYEEISTGYIFKLTNSSNHPIPLNMFKYQDQFTIKSLDIPVQQMSKALETIIE